MSISSAAIWSIGCRRLVRPGETTDASGESSNPVTPTSRPGVRPRRVELAECAERENVAQGNDPVDGPAGVEQLARWPRAPSSMLSSRQRTASPVVGRPRSLHCVAPAAEPILGQTGRLRPAEEGDPPAAGLVQVPHRQSRIRPHRRRRPTDRAGWSPSTPGRSETNGICCSFSQPCRGSCVSVCDSTNPSTMRRACRSSYTGMPSTPAGAVNSRMCRPVRLGGGAERVQELVHHQVRLVRPARDAVPDQFDRAGAQAAGVTIGPVVEQFDRAVHPFERVRPESVRGVQSVRDRLHRHLGVGGDLLQRSHADLPRMF